MAKKIRFPLEMDNGIQVRSMEELRNNFSLGRVLTYVQNDKLEIWLRDRYENNIAADIEGVVKDAIESAFAENKASIQTEDVIDAIKDTHSLSEIMKEALEKMTKEYENRKFKSASK